MSKMTLPAVIVFVALVTFGTLLLPSPSAWHGSWEGFHVPLAVSTAMAGAFFCAAWLFLSSLGAYKAKLRTVYILLSTGIVLNAIGTLQVAIINGFDLVNTLWVQSGGIVLPFTLSGVILYIGMRHFARLVGVRTVLTRTSIVVPAVLVLCALSIFLPHAQKDSPEIAVDVANAILIWVGLFDLAAAGIAFRVRQRVGSHYTNAIAWMFTALFGSAVVVVPALVVALAGSNPSNIADIIINLLSIGLGILYIQAGYAFHKTKDY